jgi:microcystin-dependent protein
MTLVTLPFRPKPGDPEDVTQIMADFDAILAVLNGGLGGDNISPTAGIPVSKIQPGTEGQVVTTVGGVPVWGSIAMPTGTILPYVVPVAPTGFLVCDGTANGNRTTHKALWDLLRQGGTTSPYGSGDGVNTFNTPNLKGRIPLGMDAAIPDFATVGKTGGEKRHKLVPTEMPIHAHTVNSHNHGGLTGYEGDHYHDLPATARPLTNDQTAGWAANRRGAINPPLANAQDVYELLRTGSAAVAHAHGVGLDAPPTDNRGGDVDHENMPPYQTVYYIIKT